MSSLALKRLEELGDQNSKSKQFGIDDQVIGEYSCALRRNILYQGKLYLFESYVCFASNVLGTDIKIVAPIKNILQVYKQTYMGFPNTLKIEVLDVQNKQLKKYYFSSFLQRDEVYTRLNNLRKQNRELLESNEFVDGLLSPTSNDGVSAASNFSDSPTNNVQQQASKKRLEGAISLDDAKFEESLQQLYDTKVEQQMTQQENEVEKEIDYTEDNYMQQFKDGYPTVNLQPAPEVPSDMELLGSDELPCSLQEYWTMFQSNQSDFNIRSKVEPGVQDVQVSQWENDEHQSDVSALLRRIVIVTAEKHMMIQATVQSNVTQSCRAYKDKLQINQVQNTTGAPLADSFQIASLIQVTQLRDKLSQPNSPLSNQSNGAEKAQLPKRSLDQKGSFNKQLKVKVEFFYRLDILKKSVFTGRILENSRSRMIGSFASSMQIAKQDLQKVKGMSLENKGIQDQPEEKKQDSLDFSNADKEFINQMLEYLPAQYHKQMQMLFKQYQRRSRQYQRQDLNKALQRISQNSSKNEGFKLQSLFSLPSLVSNDKFSYFGDEALRYYLVICLVTVLILQLVYLLYGNPQEDGVNYKASNQQALYEIVNQIKQLRRDLKGPVTT